MSHDTNTSTEPSMPDAQPAVLAPTTSRWKPLRIWPVAILLVGMVVFRYLPSILEDPPVHIWMAAAFGPALCGVLILLWWLVASRATVLERFVGLFGIIISAAVTLALIDKTMKGPAVMVLTIPMGTAAFGLGVIFFHRVLSFRRTTIALVMALVVYDGHAYGFDSAIFTAIDLETGRRDWKGGRYGKGQVLLQDESGLLLVMGEQGEVVLLKADPKRLSELGRFQAISGKTWNHPVLIGDRLYVRNSQEAACYQLPLAIQ